MKETSVRLSMSIISLLMKKRLVMGCGGCSGCKSGSGDGGGGGGGRCEWCEWCGRRGAHLVCKGRSKKEDYFDNVKDNVKNLFLQLRPFSTFGSLSPI